MECNKYTHLSEHQRDKLEKNIIYLKKEGRSSIFKVIEGSTPKGWTITNIILKLNAKQLKQFGTLIGCIYKTI